MMYQNNPNSFAAFIEGYMYAVIGERLAAGKVSEAELDNAKRLAEHCVDIHIDHSALPEEEKNAQKDKYKLWSELALAGMKKRLRESGRLMWGAFGMRLL